MISADDIRGILLAVLPEAEIEAEDMTGTNDHFEVRVKWEGFRGKGLIEQHQVVNAALKEQLDDGRIHALKIKTITP